MAQSTPPSRFVRGVCLFLLSILTLFPWAGLLPQSSVAASDGGQKVFIDSRDRLALRQASSAGGAMLVDYGSFQLWRIPAAQAVTLARHTGVAVRDDFDTIWLRGAAIDTSAPEPPVPAHMRQLRSEEPQFWLVQFIGPLKDAWLDDLRAIGLEPVIFMPSNAYLVWGDGASLRRLDALAAKSEVIQWTGAYHPAYRLAPKLLDAANRLGSAALIDVTVQLYSTKTTQETLNRLLALGGTVYKQPGRILSFTNISLQLPAGQLSAIAGWPDVYNIEPWVAPRKLDEVQGQIMAGNLTTSGGNVVPTGPGYLSWLSSKGFPTTPASYPVVDIVDDGVDAGDADNILHPDFYEFGSTSNPDRVVYIGNCTSDPLGDGEGGHGNINAGIVGSYNNLTGSPHVDGDGYRRGLGISPYGRIASTKIFANSGGYDISGCGNTDAGVVAASYNAGATFTTNSWGASVGGAYDSSSQAYDSLTRDASGSTAGNQQMLHIFAAGNSGPDVSSVGSPGTAKNVLTVGATENVRDNGIADGCLISDSNNADDMISFSSRGPTSDQRSKPDIVAPGAHIQGPASQDSNYNGSGVCDQYYPGGQTLYAWSSGTSHSTPGVAGAASLLYEYYGRVLNPGQTPSPAMLKALLLNSPRYLTGVDANDTLPSPDQGWGSVNLGLLFDGTVRTLRDQSDLLSNTGDELVITGQIADASKPFRVSLVWTDAPGSTTGNAYVNDLDLEVTAGGVYKGNVFSGAYSTTGGSFDSRNNVENVFLPAGASGSFAVRVIARNLAGDGVPGNGDATDQDFALVIYNGEEEPAPVLAATATRFDDSIGDGDGIVEPGETVSLEVDWTNQGDLDAVDVSGVVVPVGGVTMLDDTSAYPSIAVGQTATNLTPYRFTVDAACGETLSFTQTVTYNSAYTSTYNFETKVGAPVTGDTVSYPASGAAVNIPDPGTASRTIEVTDTAEIVDIDVEIDITHTWDDDLDIYLIGPDATTVELSTDNGGSGDNYTSTIFDDEAATSIVDGAAPFTGRFRPEGLLSAFDDKPANGTWTLQVTDDTGFDTGSIDGFTLTIQTREYVCDSLPVAAFSAASYSVDETAGSATLTVTLSATSAQTVTVDYATSDGTAEAGSDYTPISGTLTFAPGETQQSIAVAVLNDSAVEGDEGFSVALSNPSGALLGVPATADITIADDDDLPAIQFASATLEVDEAGGTATLTVTLSATSAQTVTVDYATSDGTAAAGSDYTPISGTLTFAPGETQQTITIPILRDATNEAEEQFLVTLSSPAGAILGTPSTAQITIRANYRVFLPFVVR